MGESSVSVRVSGLSRSYGRIRALDGVDLELGPGVTGLLGPNGAGKSTLLRILATLLGPSSGKVTVGGWDATSLRDRVEVRRVLGYLPQDLGLYPRFTAFEFVDYIAVLKELTDPRDRHRRVRAALEAVGLDDVADRRIKTLSGGMRRRVGIAQAVVADPRLVLLDEPTAGLDPQQRMRFRRLVADLGAERTVLLSTHLVEDVAAVCQTVVVMWNGRVRFSGPPAQLRDVASGWVWSSPVASPGAVSCWRSDDGAYRVVGPRPSPDALPLPPTVEDGYLWLTAGAESGASGPAGAPPASPHPASPDRAGTP